MRARLAAAILIGLTLVLAPRPSNAQADPPLQARAVPLLVEPVARQTWQPDTPEHAYRGIRAAHLADDADWILAGFTAADRPAVAGYLANPDLRAANARTMKGITQEEIIGHYTYGVHVILVVRAVPLTGKTYLRYIPMVKTPDGWSVTNGLASDPFFLKLGP